MFNGIIPVGGTTGHLFVDITDDDIVERTEYLRVETRRAGRSDRDEVTLRIRDDDVSYVQVVDNGVAFSKKFYTDIDVVYCTVGGQPRSRPGLARIVGACAAAAVPDTAAPPRRPPAGSAAAAPRSRPGLARIGGSAVTLPRPRRLRPELHRR